MTRPAARGRSEPWRRRQMRRVVELLDDLYGRPVWTPRLPPVDELVYTVLSQNTADVNTERTFAALQSRFRSWSAARDAPVAAVEEAIAPGGLAHVKAPRIQRLLRALSPGASAAASAPRGEPSLAVLDDLDDAAAVRFLTALPGVGPKTAACVLLFALRRPVMPVDTHVHRLAGRLALIDAVVTADQAHPLLTRLAGSEHVYAAHVGLVRHGRRVCHARRPRCGACGLAGICPSAGLG